MYGNRILANEYFSSGRPIRKMGFQKIPDALYPSKRQCFTINFEEMANVATAPSETALPTCSICYNNIDMGKTDQSLRCSNNHSELICNDCFVETDKCPICRKNTDDKPSMARAKRTIGLRKLKTKMTALSQNCLKMMEQFQSKELKSIYESKMASAMVELRNSFLEMLRVQAISIVRNHFMAETEEDRANLMEIDECILQLTGAGKYKDTDFGKLMLSLQGLEQKQALQYLMQQPNIVFTVAGR